LFYVSCLNELYAILTRLASTLKHSTTILKTNIITNLLSTRHYGLLIVWNLMEDNKNDINGKLVI
jgi:hypothetical protein